MSNDQLLGGLLVLLGGLALWGGLIVSDWIARAWRWLWILLANWRINRRMDRYMRRKV